MESKLWPLARGAFLLALLLAGCGQQPTIHPGSLGIDGLTTIQAAQVREAADGWNQGIGREHFTISQHPAISVIFTRRQHPAEYEDGIFYHRIFIDPEQQPGEILSCLYHELGHSMGLEHDTDPTSVMYPWLNAYDRPRPNEADVIRARLATQ